MYKILSTFLFWLKFQDRRDVQERALNLVGFILLDLLFGEGVLVFDVDSEHPIEAHPLVRDPGQQKEGEYVAAPVFKEDLKTSNNKNEQGDPMAEAIFAGPDVAKFTDPDALCGLTLSLGEISRFFEDLFLSDGPGNGRDDE